jgi:hypothetical protein
VAADASVESFVAVRGLILGGSMLAAAAVGFV